MSQETIDQAPQLEELTQAFHSEEDLIQAIRDTDKHISDLWEVVRKSYRNIGYWVAQSIQLRAQLRMMRTSKPSGTTEPICPDGTANDG